ncbi:MAG: hypothetical protein Q8858_06805 [Bacteroidota bacterium]|nr:hypothetical protein [Bacteroidota bacterium]
MKQFLKLIHITAIWISLTLCISAQSKFNSVVVTDTFLVNFSNRYLLSAVTIIPSSETVKLKGKVLAKGDYSVFLNSSSVSLSDSIHPSVLDTFTVTYSTILSSLKKEYKRRSLVVKYNDKLADTVRIIQKEQTGFSSDAIFGREIQKSGSIVRGFTVGTTRDFTLNSGLRLQLSGKLADDVQIVAALTDENVPIQPEGNTERLDELDKVFIEIRHPNAVGTFGDYDLQSKLGEFGAIDRKLQGLKGEVGYGSSKATIAVASSKGKFNNNQFTGSEGVQGPYRLTGVNGEREIIVIAGSEKVYLNGEEMKRGERNDYTIDYSTSEVSFTPNKLITSASRISVDFEYTDRRYARNFFGTSFQTDQLDNKLKVKLNYFREGDNQDAPIDLSFSDDDKSLIASAGSNRLAASKTGIVAAAADSTGIIKGTYSKVDTLINGKPFSYYIYTPGKGLFNVSFSFVGSGSGDYIKESLGNYKFAGIAQGSYAPVILLPLPELKQTGNLAIEASPFKDVSFNVERAGSLWDKNRFSNLSSKNEMGSARNLSFVVKPNEVELWDLKLGKIGLSYRDRYIQEKFSSIDRINEVEFSRNYNITDASIAQNEILREASLNLFPIEQLNVNSTYGYLKRGESFVSKRFKSDMKLSEGKKYDLDYTLDYVGSRNEGYLSNWLRQSGKISYLFGKVKPSFNFLAEDKKDKLNNADSLISSSLKYYEASPAVEFINLGGFNFKAEYSFREDSYPADGIMSKESYSNTQSYELGYHGISEVSSNLNFTIRNKKYTDVFKKKGLSNNETILVRSQSRFNFWQNIVNGDFYYEGSTQRAARLERVFVKVQQGTGNYKYLGDLNKNGIPDQNEFEPTIYDGDYISMSLPTDQLFPVIDLKMNTRWRLNFERIFAKNTLAHFFLSPLSTETVYRVEENSKETNLSRIYLLHLSSFLNDSTTIKGNNLFQQDLFIFENSNELSFRLRYQQTKSLAQYSDGIEKGFTKERSLRIKFRMVEEISNQTDIVNSTDYASAPVNSNRSRKVTGNSFSTDFSYRPIKNLEAGFKILASRSQDDLPANPTVINQNSQTLRITLSFAETGRFRFEFERNELLSNTTTNYIPFEITKGNLLGKNYFWRLNLDYRIASNLQSTVSYDGRLQGPSSVVNTARAEVRAYF